MTMRELAQKLRRRGAAWLLPAWFACPWHQPAAGQDYTFTTNTGSVTITRYNGPGGAVSVPPAIDGLPVTSIGDSAFGFNYGITSVTFPGSVTNLGQLVFVSCTRLTNVTLSASVAAIGELAFKDCTGLSTIAVSADNPVFSGVDGVLFNKEQTMLVQYPQGKSGGRFAVPDGVLTLAAGAFYGCASLTNLALPASLQNIQDAAFYACTNLVDAAIPDGVTNVGVQAFLNCQCLTQAMIPDSVVTLGLQAFYFCGGLTNAMIGNHVVVIGDNTFTGCSNLRSVTLGASVAAIGSFAFADCLSLTSLTPDGALTNINQAAFSYCFDLTNLTLPVGLARIDSAAFQFCSRLSSIDLPASVASIGDRVFEFCSGLTNLTVDPGNPRYESIDGVLFDRLLARLLQYPVNSPRSHYTIPAGTAAVADTAFVSAFNLTSVTIPSSVTNLETLAFYDCADVSGFFFEGNAPELGDNVFDLDAVATVYYLAGTINWGATLDGLPTALWDPAVPSVRNASGLEPFGFTVTGTTNIPLVVEATTDLANGPWSIVQSVVLTNGSFCFLDLQSTNFPRRYYRIRSP